MTGKWSVWWLLVLLSGAAWPAGPTTWERVLAQPVSATGLTLAYGPLPDQFAELRLPAGDGPHPVVVMLHGGCWLPDFDLAHVRPLAEAITALGYATWNVEYRRPTENENGWPHTFLDAAAALQALGDAAGEHALDLDRITLLGHSAGGQLALWLAARPGFEPDHPLFEPGALPVERVLALAPITDMVAYAAQDQGCPAGARRVLGGPPEQWPQRYRAVSPLDNLPGRVGVELVHARDDGIVPLAHSARLAQRLNAIGGQARVHVLAPPAGHFDVLLTSGAAWQRLEALLLP
ncbi:MAG: alpha/beta hydrolase [Wenzhouxiangella sp.]|nr:alpha/beta hydrolase [Wenzhouxiangella sp.]